MADQKEILTQVEEWFCFKSVSLVKEIRALNDIDIGHRKRGLESQGMVIEMAARNIIKIINWFILLSLNLLVIIRRLVL